MFEDSARVVEHDGIGLARRRSQHAADHLPIQAHMLRRAGEHDARHVGLVPPLGQHHAIRDDLDIAARQAGQDGLAIIDGR